MSESDGKLSVKTYGKQAKGHGNKTGGELLKVRCTWSVGKGGLNGFCFDSISKVVESIWAEQ